jgi:hypothetical protein
MQFHPEVDAAALDGWYHGLPHAPAQARGERGERSRRRRARAAAPARAAGGDLRRLAGVVADRGRAAA